MRAPVVKMGDIVHVLWEDSVIGHGWSSYPPPNISMAAQSVGFLMQKDNNAIVLACSMGPRSDFLSPLHIPMSAVRSIKKLQWREAE